MNFQHVITYTSYCVTIGSDLAPKAASTRWLASVWYYFTIIFVASYTANLAAFLCIERLYSDINSVEDLSKQSRIQYGTLASGSTYEFFQVKWKQNK